MAKLRRTELSVDIARDAIQALGGSASPANSAPTRLATSPG